MGTTLQNGVYLPNEGERNCYAGLKTNWEILDQKVADVTALQQAVAGALHREIVESLPTTDIDPNTIYMILSGTSATENVYDEFMYVNNAWELIGTSATDLTNYYTKGEVDGLLLLKANASDLTSHTGDTTIHVTANDKTKWTNSANTHVLRLALSALTPSTSDNSFSNLDDSTALKVGDKVMDTAGVLFEVTAIDTQNSTFTIGTALIDLAQDSDVVHNTGNETISGEKKFNNLQIVGYGTQYKGSRNAYILPEFSAGYAGLAITTLGLSQAVKIGNFVLDANNKPSLDASKGYIQFATGESNGINACILEPKNSTSSSLGSSANRWSKIYGTEYYYGSNNVEFSTKFVTTDTAQTISGGKTFSDNLTIYNSDDTVTPKGLTIKNAQWSMGENGATTVSNINFLDKNSSIPVSIMASKGASGQSFLRFSVRTKDSQNTTYLEEIYYVVDTSGNVDFRPWHDNIISLGTSIYRWKDFYTNKINGLEPSSLGMPSDRSARIDISSYITNLGNGDTNAYTVPANGYIWLHFTSVTGIICYSQTSSTMTNYAQTFTRSQGDGQLYAFFPVRKDDRFVVQIYTSSTGVVQNAYFIPCRGNI